MNDDAVAHQKDLFFYISVSSEWNGLESNWNVRQCICSFNNVFLLSVNLSSESQCDTLVAFMIR